MIDPIRLMTFVKRPEYSGELQKMFLCVINVNISLFEITSRRWKKEQKVRRFFFKKVEEKKWRKKLKEFDAREFLLKSLDKKKIK